MIYNCCPDGIYKVGWVNLYQIFNVFIIRQAHLPPKVPKQANFCGSLQKTERKLNELRILALRSDKTIQDREPIFCSKVPMLKFFKTTLLRTPKQIIFELLLYTSKTQNYILKKIRKCAKKALTHKKNIKSKGQI